MLGISAKSSLCRPTQNTATRRKTKKKHLPSIILVFVYSRFKDELENVSEAYMLLGSYTRTTPEAHLRFLFQPKSKRILNRVERNIIYN